MASDFEREAMILSEFDHPNIVKLYGVRNRMMVVKMMMARKRLTMVMVMVIRKRLMMMGEVMTLLKFNHTNIVKLYRRGK